MTDGIWRPCNTAPQITPGASIWGSDGMIETHTIQDWLNDGHDIYSCAMGRIGKVVGTNHHGDVVIDSIKKSIGRCVTTFERGDSVSAVREGGMIKIINKEEDWLLGERKGV